MEVIKSDGRRVPFDEDKVRRSILRTGSSKEVANNVLARVLPQMMDGMSTREIYAIVRGELKKENVCYACRYNLREAILLLGPAGFHFEQYVAAILRAYDYDAIVPEDEIEGSCVSHEVDVVAKKDGRSIFIEAKFRNDYRDDVSLKDTMATWARYLDLVDGAAVGKGMHFDDAWIVTNARFSGRAEQFGTCKGMRLVGWNVPEDAPFSTLVDARHLYPITVIDDLRPQELAQFSRLGWMLCADIADRDPEEVAERTGLPIARAEYIVKTCIEVVENKNPAAA